MGYHELVLIVFSRVPPVIFDSVDRIRGAPKAHIFRPIGEVEADILVRFESPQQNNLSANFPQSRLRREIGFPRTITRKRRREIIEQRRILHVLNRVGFGPRPGDVERVRAVGLEAWIDRQLHPETIDDRATERALAELASIRLSIPEALREYPRPDPGLREKVQNGEMTRAEMMETYPPEKRPFRIAAELQAAKTLRAVESERQLQEVMVDFWFNHFNVFAAKGDVRWYVSAYERDVVRPNALGRFADLVRASARHPAMLFYLDNWLSARRDFTVPAGPNKGRKAGLNENYARELMELHTLGVDGGYTQTDVTEVARAFTGWSIDRPQVEGRFVFRPRMHDTGEKVVLGHRIPAGGGQDDGERVLEILTHHPATARFIATKLVRRFVADTPPPPLVTGAP